MEKSIISEGKTTNEAIENGLKELNVTKNMVDIKVLENEEKRSFFSILTPRVVKVQLTIKEKSFERVKREIELSSQELEKAQENVERFLDEFIKKLGEEKDYSIESYKEGLKVNITNLGFLIGYRGETLYSFQNILSAIASKGLENRAKVILDIQGYKQKREKTLQDLADKLANTVMKTKRTITLEPMQAYERKIIHSKLQDYKNIETRSIGEEPRRKIIISLKKK